MTQLCRDCKHHEAPTYSRPCVDCKVIERSAWEPKKVVKGYNVVVGFMTKDGAEDGKQRIVSQIGYNCHIEEQRD